MVIRDWFSSFTSIEGTALSRRMEGTGQLQSGPLRSVTFDSLLISKVAIGISRLDGVFFSSTPENV